MVMVTYFRVIDVVKSRLANFHSISYDSIRNIV